MGQGNVHGSHGFSRNSPRGTGNACRTESQIDARGGSDSFRHPYGRRFADGAVFDQDFQREIRGGAPCFEVISRCAVLSSAVMLKNDLPTY